MDKDGAQTSGWENTKKAVANFRQLMLCSKCSNLMQEPVCLGMCEHMLCRYCAGPQAGDGCVVCDSPAWAKDIQINRQLSNIVQLFSGLESLLNPDEQPADPAPAKIQTPPESPVIKQKKNFKIWFSPRSAKVRCRVNNPSEVTVLESRTSGGEEAAAQPGAVTAEHRDLSVFNFPSSSENSGSPSSQRCKDENRKKKKRSYRKNAASKRLSVQGSSRTARKLTKVMTMKRLEAINQQWGITGKAEAVKEREQPGAEGARRSSKRVSFLSPAVTSDEPQPEVLQGSTNELSPGRSSMRESLSGESPVLNDQTQSSSSMSDSGAQHDKTSPNDSSPPRLMSRFVRNSPPPANPRCNKSPKTSGRPTPESPAVMKRNHKGETPLHLAAIKGNVEAVTELLDQGADPNLKDNAGWTPLHEACNLGHLAVVEVLVSRGALLNTPGYENDSPLHDAVRNGHPAVVRRLLQQGASQNVLNLHGKRPTDYAVSQEMLEIFQEASEGTQYANTSLSPSASLSVVSDCVMRDETLVFLSSKLSEAEQLQLAKLGELLGGKMADTFSDSVSHVVLPEGHLPTTFPTLLGLLAGCWLVKFSWVETCLQAGKWMPEIEHEVGEGPQRCRINRCNLLPPLFDGCFFFLLGSFKGPSKDQLIRLLREGGGQLLNRRPKPDSDVTQTRSATAYHALPGSDQALCTQYIIFDPSGSHKPAVVRRGKVWSAPSTWLINCIAAFRLLPVPDRQMLA